MSERVNGLALIGWVAADLLAAALIVVDALYG